MNTYLRTLHMRPDSHKRAFALAVSGIFTLLIFSIWSFVSFGQTASLAQASNQDNVAAVTAADVAFAGTTTAKSPTPFQDILTGIKTSYNLLMHNLNGR